MKTSKTSNKKLKNGKKPRSKKEWENLIIHIGNLSLSINFDDDFEDKNKIKVKNIVKHLSKDIWIDKTYVLFPGNRFKDAFIKEDGWVDLLKNIKAGGFGTKQTKNDDMISSALISISIVYMYDILAKYGFDVDKISIGVKSNLKFYTEYYNDTRTSWNF